MEGKGNSSNSTQGSIDLTDQPTWRKIAETKLSRRKFLQVLGVTSVGVLGMPACTSNSPKGEGPTPKSTPAAPTKEPTLIPEKDTVLGKTLAMGEFADLKQVPGQEIAKRIDARGKGLKIVVDEKGNSLSFTVFYTDENGRKTETTVIAQGPKDYEWQGKPGQQFWQKVEEHEVFIPDAPLPGGWNGQYAAPVAIAESAHLAQDKDGKHKILFLYSKDTVEKLKAGNNLGKIEVLSDGSGLFIIEGQDYELKEGETITREENNNLRLTQKDGSYKIMITSWQNVKSEEDLYRVRQFAGPLEKLPELAYPPEKLSQDAITAYAKAMGIEPEKVQLTYKELKDKNGKTFVVAATNDGTPLLINVKNSEGKTEWTTDTIKPLFNLNGLKIGGHVDGSEEYKKPIYEKTVNGNFDILFPAGAFYQRTLDKGDPSTKVFIDMTHKDNSILYIHPALDRYDQEYLEKIPAEQRPARMRERAKTLLQFVKKVDGVQQKQPTYINIFNEPFGRYITPGGKDVAIWKIESVAQQTLGENTLIDTYIMFHEEAKAQGLEIGKDVFFFFSEYGINTNNPKKDMALRELQRAKIEISKRLGIPVEQVKFGLAIEQRYDETNPLDLPNDQRGRIRPPTEQELESTTKEFQKVADWIMFTETSDFPATPEQRQRRFATLTRIARKLGVLGIIFENPLRFHNKQPDVTSANTDLFRADYEKSTEYFNLARDAFNLL